MGLRLAKWLGLSNDVRTPNALEREHRPGAIWRGD
jgi:hypothetical protein